LWKQWMCDSRMSHFLTGLVLTLLSHTHSVTGTTSEVLLADYHNYTQLIGELATLAESYPDIARLYVLGQSVEGRDLAVIQISKDVQKDRKLLKPMVKLIANMHGNEAVGREVLLALARYLLQNSDSDPRISSLLSSLDVHILPSLNPDGFENSTKGVCAGYHVGTGRHNGNLVDLNRAFPTWDNLSLSQEQLTQTAQPEVAAVIDWVFSQPFVLSANFHDGAVVANYPWDDSEGEDGQMSLTPDDATFRGLASLYATKHANMAQGVGLCQGDNFKGGITNGAEWYIVEGGMQDFNYLYSNCMELTMELSCCKYPEETELQKHWEDNREALLSYLEVAMGGMRGLVTDKQGHPVQGAVITVLGLEEKNVTTSFLGEWWRLLVPGTYCVRALGPGLDRSSDWTKVVLGALDSKQHVSLDFVLGEEGEMGEGVHTGAVCHGADGVPNPNSSPIQSTSTSPIPSTTTSPGGGAAIEYSTVIILVSLTTIFCNTLYL